MRLSLSKEVSLEVGGWKLSPSFVNGNGSMSISPSGDMTDAKWFSLAISLPTKIQIIIMKLYFPF